MGKTMAMLLGGVLFVVMVPVIALGSMTADSSQPKPPEPLNGTNLDPSKVPNKDWVKWVEKAGQLCPEVSPPLIAAQIEQESTWDPTVVSDKGAIGLSQFMPGTWADYGQDENNDGSADPTDPPDAIMSQGHYDCALAKQVEGYIASGQASGDPITLMLAAYNAGPGKVLTFHGVPPYKETQGYVIDIRKRMVKYTLPSGPGAPGGGPPPVNGAGSAQGKAAVAAAMTALDTSYRYGGNCTDPQSSDIDKHCDCSSLMQMAWGKVGVNIPRVTGDQVDYGTPVHDFASLQAGDLLFEMGSDPVNGKPGHVGMYMGDGRVIEAPHTGVNVRIDPFSDWKNLIVAMRHVA